MVIHKDFVKLCKDIIKSLLGQNIIYVASIILYDSC